MLFRSSQLRVIICVAWPFSCHFFHQRNVTVCRTVAQWMFFVFSKLCLYCMQAIFTSVWLTCSRKTVLLLHWKIHYQNSWSDYVHPKDIIGKTNYINIFYRWQGWLVRSTTDIFLHLSEVSASFKSTVSITYMLKEPYEVSRNSSVWPSSIYSDMTLRGENISLSFRTHQSPALLLYVNSFYREYLALLINKHGENTQIIFYFWVPFFYIQYILTKFSLLSSALLSFYSISPSLWNLCVILCCLLHANGLIVMHSVGFKENIWSSYY